MTIPCLSDGIMSIAVLNKRLKLFFLREEALAEFGIDVPFYAGRNSAACIQCIIAITDEIHL